MKSKIRYSKLLSVFIICYIIFFGYICYLKYDSFAYNDFDVAIDTQSLYSITHGSINSSIHRIPFLGNHMRLILFLIAPLYAVFPSALTLIFIQTLLLGLGGWGIYLIAREVIGEASAFLFASIYLIYPALGYLNLYEFHPTALATFFLIFMFYFYQKHKFIWFNLFMFLALCCQENIPLVLIFFAIFALIQKRSKVWVLVPFFIGIIYFYLAIYVLMPFLGKNTVQFLKLYAHLGNNLPQVVINIILHPIAILKFMFTGEKILYLSKLLGPLSFMSLFSPLFLIPSIPLFMQHLLSLNFAETTIYYHYQAELIPFIFISAIYGFRRLMSLRIVKNYTWFFKIIIFIFAIIYAHDLGPYIQLTRNIPMFKKDYLDIQKERLISLIPKDASVLATFEFQPKLANRKELYSFHHVFSGYNTLSDKKYDIPKKIDYILMDANDFLTFSAFYRIGNDRNIRALIKDGKYAVYENIDNLILFKREYSSDKKLYGIHKAASVKIKGKASVLELDNKIKLLSLGLERAGDKIIRLRFIWKCLKKTESDLAVFLYFSNKRKSLFYGKAHPIGYRIYPTSAWLPGEIIEENFLALFPSTEFSELVKIEIFELSTGRSLLSKSLNSESN